MVSDQETPQYPITLPDGLSEQDLDILSEVEQAKPWDRQPHETPLQFAVFAAYRDLGPDRTVRDAVVRVRKAGIGGLPHRDVPAVVVRWFREHNWILRARAWDNELDRQRQQVLITRQREAAAKQFEMGNVMADKLMERLVTMDPNRINPRDFPVWANAIQRVVNTALGQKETVVHEVTGPGGTPLSIDHIVQMPEQELNERLRVLVREHRRELQRYLDTGRPGPGDAAAGEAAAFDAGVVEGAGEEVATAVEYHPAGGADSEDHP